MRCFVFSLLLLLGIPCLAQPLRFGSADALDEWGAGRPSRDLVELAGFTGAAYLPAAWRGAVRAEAEALSGRISVGLAQTGHPAAGGLYAPEADEAYDLLRSIRYLRLNPTASSRLYARLGPTQHLTLGTGALAQAYGTSTAWDERTIGVEAALERGAVSGGLFVDDVRLNGVAGGQVEVQSDASVGRLRKIRAGVAGVHDLGLPRTRGDSSLTGVEAWLAAEWIGDQTFEVAPFVTAARYLGRGGTVGVGVNAGAYNLSNAVRAGLQVAVFASGSGFVPGHVGPFYAVSNSRDRIVTTDSFYDEDPAFELAGTPLDSVRSGVDVVANLRLLAFGRFEVAQTFRRHIGPDQLSAYGLRLGAALPGDAEVAFELERQGFRGVFGLFGDLEEENLLRLDVRVPLAEPVVLLVHSRYGYRVLAPSEVGLETFPNRRFLIERRFEPMIGLRIRPF